MAPKAEEHFMKDTLAKKARQTFFQLVVFGGFLVFGALRLGKTVYPRLVVIKDNLTGAVKTVCGCNVGSMGLSWSSLGILLLGITLVCFFIVMTAHLVYLIRETTRFVRRNGAHAPQKISAKAERAAYTLGLSGRVHEIEGRELAAFCHGFFWPKICVSSELVQRLTDKELLAVLSHEQHHLETYEPIKTFLVKLMTKSFFFIPWFRRLAKKYFTYAELAADEQALRRLNDKASLARALEKMITWRARTASRDSLALSFFETVTEERINRLVDDGYVPRFTIFTWRSMTGTLAFVAAAFFIRPIFFVPIVPVSDRSKCEGTISETVSSYRWCADRPPVIRSKIQEYGPPPVDKYH